MKTNEVKKREMVKEFILLSIVLVVVIVVAILININTKNDTTNEINNYATDEEGNEYTINGITEQMLDNMQSLMDSDEYNELKAQFEEYKNGNSTNENNTESENTVEGDNKTDENEGMTADEVIESLDGEDWHYYVLEDRNSY